jgi:hypothetical protein
MTGRIGAGDPKYDRVIRKQFNKRFRAQPDYVRLIGSTDDAIAASLKVGHGRVAAA